MSLLMILSVGCMLAWMTLRWLRGGFWQTDRFFLGDIFSAASENWPEVAIVVPARDEAETIAAVVSHLLAQDYPGKFSLFVVDDCSDDDTACLAQGAAKTSSRFTLINGRARPSGWTGKLWALQQGLDAVNVFRPEATWLWFTDADIIHGADTLRNLVQKAKSENLSLVSLMVHLRCKDFWERLLIPAFIFFFQKLYPFSWVNDPARRVAAAAGGCVLVRRKVFMQAGGVAALRGKIIDDCAIAALVKPHGRVWLGHARDSESLRQYPCLNDVWKMVTRTAFAYLEYSSVRLVIAVLGMALLYLMPWATLTAGAATANPILALIGLIAVTLQMACYIPTLRAYERSPLWALSLPVAASLYTLMTVDSARRHWLGRGGEWKGRTFNEAPARQETYSEVTQAET